MHKLKSLFAHQGFRRYFKNTSWLFGEKVLRMFVGLFVSIWIARYLGPDQFGLFSYAQSFVGLFTAIAALGLDAIVVRELVKDENRRDILLGSAFILKLIGAVVVLIVLGIAVNFTGNDSLTNVLIFIIASAAIFQSFNVIDFYFQSRVLSRYVVYANVITLLLSSLIKIALILYKAPLIAFAWMVLFDSVILAAGFGYFYFHNHLGFKTWKADKHVMVQLLKDGFPLALSIMAIAFYMKIDQVMIKEMMDANAVGQYAAAVRISEAWYFIPAVIASSLFPAIVNAKKLDGQLYINRLQSLTSLLFTLSLFVVVVIFFLGDWLIHLTFGGAYDESSGVLKVYILSGLFVSIGFAAGKWYMTENMNAFLLFKNCAGAVLNIILNLVFIKAYGLVGAAYATLVSMVFVAFVTDLFYIKARTILKVKLQALFFKNLLYKT